MLKLHDEEISISFCVTCHNRLWQLKLTLFENLRNLGPSDELVLVDYKSNDGLKEWVWNNFPNEISMGKLIYFEVINEIRWNVARAKNLAHRLSNKNYLFNLDADNYLSILDVQQIRFAAQLNSYTHQWSGQWGDGTFGRIGIPRKVFMDIGGYDETFLPMAGQDADVINRLKYLCIPFYEIKPVILYPVKNTMDEKITAVVDLFGGINSSEYFKHMNKINMDISDFKLKSEGPIRLGGGFSYEGFLCGNMVIIDGFNNIYYQS